MNGEPDGMNVRADVFRSRSDAALASLMSTDPHDRGSWTETEYADILRHQLAAPVLFDLSRLEPSERERIQQLLDRDAGSLSSFGQLLTHPNPPVELLLLTKEFAKSSDAGDEQLLPAPVASVLYLASIFAAFLRTGTRISQLTDEQLREGAVWATAKPWLNDPLRRIFEEALRAIGH